MSIPSPSPSPVSPDEPPPSLPGLLPPLPLLPLRCARRLLLLVLVVVEKPNCQTASASSSWMPPPWSDSLQQADRRGSVWVDKCISQQQQCAASSHSLVSPSNTAYLPHSPTFPPNRGGHQPT